MHHSLARRHSGSSNHNVRQLEQGPVSWLLKNGSTASPPPDAGRAETRDVVRMDAATICWQDDDQVYRRRSGIRGAITPFARRCGSAGPLPHSGDPTASEGADKSVRRLIPPGLTYADIGI
jgi:hypothetical protein